MPINPKTFTGHSRQNEKFVSLFFMRPCSQISHIYLQNSCQNVSAIFKFYEPKTCKSTM